MKSPHSAHNVTEETLKCFRKGAGPGAEEEGENFCLSSVSLLRRQEDSSKVMIEGIMDLRVLSYMN